MLNLIGVMVAAVAGILVIGLVIVIIASAKAQKRRNRAARDLFDKEQWKKILKKPEQFEK